MRYNRFAIRIVLFKEILKYENVIVFLWCFLTSNNFPKTILIKVCNLDVLPPAQASPFTEKFVRKNTICESCFIHIIAITFVNSLCDLWEFKLYYVVFSTYSTIQWMLWNMSMIASLLPFKTAHSKCVHQKLATWCSVICKSCHALRWIHTAAFWASGSTGKSWQKLMKVGIRWRTLAFVEHAENLLTFGKKH
jgi:hypothetical protein